MNIVPRQLLLSLPLRRIYCNYCRTSFSLNPTDMSQVVEWIAPALKVEESLGKSQFQNDLRG